MRFGWASGLVIAAGIALASCGQGRDDLAENARQAAFFMESNARADGVQTLPSGLQYKVVVSGPQDGVSPDTNDLVRVDYEGALTDGTVFDSSFERGAPAVMTPERLIPGWTEALQMMKPGDEWLLYVPPELGYGERGGPPVIPPNAVLIFRLKLLDVARAPGGGARAQG
jgi:FKBP-type peptidyl-prolyl cis-trans isomerase FklB